MILNLIGPFTVNAPFGTEIAFAKGLRRLGHTVIECDPNFQGCQVDHAADATLVFKSCVGREQELLAGFAHHASAGPIVVYQPDDARFPHIREMMMGMRMYADLFLSFDDYGAEVARTMGYRAAETLLLTADDELYCPPKTSVVRDIDVSFIGSLADPAAHASRRRMIEEVIEFDRKHGMGWRMFFGGTQHIDTIVDIYRRSKVVLNHATDVGQPFGYGFGLQCRHFEVGMCGTPILSNQVYGGTSDGTPQLNFCTFGTVNEMLDRVHAIVNGVGSSPRQLGQVLYDQIRRQHLPQHRAAQLVSFIEGNR